MRYKTIYIGAILLLNLFCSLIIVGESSASFYIGYVIGGFFHGTLFGILGIAGLLGFLVGFLIPSIKNKIISFLLGTISEIASLLVFFLTDPSKYNYPTFSHPIPLMLMTSYSICASIFVATAAFQIVRHLLKRNS